MSGAAHGKTISSNAKSPFALPHTTVHVVDNFCVAALV